MNTLSPQLENAVRFYLTPLPHPTVGDCLAKLLEQFPKSPSPACLPLLCDVLYWHHHWDGFAEKPQLWTLRWAIEALLPRFAPEDLTEFWNRLQSANSIERTAMEQGLELLTSQHCLEHLLHGLETCTRHSVRTKIVNVLEKVGDSSVLPRLFQVYRHSAEHDWALGQQIERALRSILLRTDVDAARTLLRSSQEPYEDLLRRVTNPPEEVSDLLLVAEESEDSSP